LTTSVAVQQGCAQGGEHDASRMSIKKRIRAGRIEPSSDGNAIVVHFTTEITHYDEDGVAGVVEKMPDKKEVQVAKSLCGVGVADLPDLAQALSDRCRYIPASKVRQVEQALAKLLARQAHRQNSSCSPSPRRLDTDDEASSAESQSRSPTPEPDRHRRPRRSTRLKGSPSPPQRHSRHHRHQFADGNPQSDTAYEQRPRQHRGHRAEKTHQGRISLSPARQAFLQPEVGECGASQQLSNSRNKPLRDLYGSSSNTPPASTVLARPADMLPEARMDMVDEYADELYEENMEAKACGARRLLRLCIEVYSLEEISEHVTLLGVLSRELRENAKRSHELAVAIVGIFVCLAHFSQFHPVLSQHQCGDATLRVVEYEGKRVKALQKELKLAQGRLIARGSEATDEERHRLEREEGRYRAIIDRQDRLLLLCVQVLRDLSEDTVVERQFVGQRICHLLVPLLSRQNEALLLGVLGFLHKISVFEQNKDHMVHSMDAICRLAELVGHPNGDVALLALRLCYNLSFDRAGREALAKQTSLVGRLVSIFQFHNLRPVSLKLLYHLSMDAPLRALIAYKYQNCVGLALALVVRGKERQLERDAVALCINLSADEGCAAIMLEDALFSRLVNRGTQNSDPLLLKVVRHVASHRSIRSKMLRVLREESNGEGGAGRRDRWLYEVTRLACRYSDSPEGLVEALGILSNLDCPSPEVPWVELLGLGLLDLMHRLLMVGFSEDDVLLECIGLASVLALDSECAPLLAASKVPTLVPLLLSEKQADDDILIQLLHAMQCLLLQEETAGVVLEMTDAPERILDVLHDASQQPLDASAQAVQNAANAVLDLVLHYEEQENRTQRWTEAIRTYRFEAHNVEWVQGLTQEPTTPKRSAADTRNGNIHHWSDVGGLADRCWG